MGERGVDGADPGTMAPLTIERKVAGGKLFRLRIGHSDQGFSVQLTGDFFLEPEEGIDAIECCLVECIALSDRKEAERALAEAVSKARLQITGFGAEDLIDALWEARAWAGD